MPSPTMSEPRLKQTLYLSKVYFGDALHLAFRHHKVSTFQSWKDATKYNLEIQFIDAPSINCEYDGEPLWLAVISLLDQAMSKVWLP